ncbi:MAG: ABC transporter substrate-binding protein [Rhodoferax sp.]|nr:ABC transporter substrate-binding protein [Rhodoferax sp.]
MMTSQTRRRLALGVAASTLAFMTSFALAQGQGPIKLGVVNIDSGPFALNGAYINDGATFAVESLNAQGGALGRKYELVIQNHAGTPATAMAAAAKLVEQGGVSFFTGLNASSTALAITAKVAGMNALFLDATATSDDLTGKNCNKNYFRIDTSDSMVMNGLRAQLQASGIKSWDLLMADYAVGHDYAKKFAALVQDNGGTIEKTIFASMSATDLGSYISQLNAKPAEGLAMLYPSSAGNAFAKQQRAFGLFAKYKTVLSASTVNEVLLSGQGDSTVGVYGTQSYFWSMPGEQNAAFVKAFEGRFKRKPTYLDVDAYLAFELLHNAILKAKSTDVDAVRSALAGLKARTVVGDVEMRAADHQLLRPLLFMQAVKAGEGKAEMALRGVEPLAKVTAPVSPECKL